jgi:hypothetical protein
MGIIDRIMNPSKTITRHQAEKRMLAAKMAWEVSGDFFGKNRKPELAAAYEAARAVYEQVAASNEPNAPPGVPAPRTRADYDHLEE